MSEPKRIDEIIHELKAKPIVLNGVTNIIAVRSKMENKTNNICGKCKYAHFPNGHCKVQSGRCYKITGSDSFYVDVMRNSNGCKEFVKKKRRR